MVTKIESFILPVHRVYSNEDSGHCEDSKIQEDPVAGLQNNITDVVQVGKRAVSTSSRFGAF